MCNKKEGCLQPKEAKGDPAKCSPEQIKKCHGNAKDHPCVPRPSSRTCSVYGRSTGRRSPSAAK